MTRNLPREGGFDDPVLQHAGFQRLLAILQSLEGCAIAFSGGVDSTFLLFVARRVLGDRAVGVLAVSESLDASELEDAHRTASVLGIPLELVETHEYLNAEYRKNDGTRCYHCKTELFQVVRAFAAARGILHVLDGSNADDVGDFRPGLRARDEQGVRSPLLEAGLDKASIRSFSRALGLPTWDKPAAPCLSSRIPYGSPVTARKLRQIEAAEKGLRDLGFRILRVRHHDQVGRIEVPAEEIGRLCDPAIRERAVAAVKAAGFVHVAVDLEGFRSGGLNLALAPDVRARAQGLVPVGEVGILEGRGGRDQRGELSAPATSAR